jgi:hypothetical protein
MGVLGGSGVSAVGGGAPQFAVNNNVTAHAGGGQAGAPVCPLDTITIVTTVASAGDSVILPSATGSGRMVVVVNMGANTMHVYPAVGEQLLGAGGVNAFKSPGVNAVQPLWDIGVGLWTYLLAQQ